MTSTLAVPSIVRSTYVANNNYLNISGYNSSGSVGRDLNIRPTGQLYINVTSAVSLGTINSDITLIGGLSSTTVGGNVILKGGTITTGMQGSIYIKGTNVNTGYTTEGPFYSTFKVLSNTINFTDAYVKYLCVWIDDIDLFCSISPTGYIRYSSNGTTWTQAFTNIKVDKICNFKALCWSPELKLLVAVGDDTATFLNYRYNIIVSPDAKKWNTVPISYELNAISAICWSSKLEIFCATGSGVKSFIISRDGYNWIPSKSQVSSSTFTGITWGEGPGVFVAIGNTNNYKIAVSSDGFSWSYNNGLTTVIYSDIAYSEYLNLFVAVGGGASNNISYSSDGIIWSVDGTSYTTNLDYSRIIWCSTINYFITIVTSQTSFVYYSTDGKIWSSYVYVDANTYRDICWSPKLQKLIFLNSNGTITSSAQNFDKFNISQNIGTVVSNSTVNVDSANINIGVNSASTDLYTNSVGTVELYGTVNYDKNLTVNDTHLGDSSIIIGSTNLSKVNKDIQSSWRLTYLTNSQWSAVSWSSKLMLFVTCSRKYDATAGANGRKSFAYSPSGATWSYGNGGTSIMWNNVLWNPDLEHFIAIGENNGSNSFPNLSYSTNGITWTTIVSPYTATKLNGICWSYERSTYVAVGENSTSNIFYSNNGLTWVSVASVKPSVPWTAVAYISYLNRFCAVGLATNEAIMTTQFPHLSWSVQSYTNTSNYKTVAYDPNKQITVIAGLSSGGGKYNVLCSNDCTSVNNWRSYNDGDSYNSYNFRNVIYNKQLGVFQAVSDAIGTYSSFLTSTDGMLWTENGTPNSSVAWTGIAWSPELGIYCSVTPTNTANNTNSCVTQSNIQCTKKVNIGNYMQSDISILGNDIYIGRNADVINIGNYATNISINGELVNVACYFYGTNTVKIGSTEARIIAGTNLIANVPLYKGTVYIGTGYYCESADGIILTSDIRGKFYAPYDGHYLVYPSILATTASPLTAGIVRTHYSRDDVTFSSIGIAGTANTSGVSSNGYSCYNDPAIYYLCKNQVITFSGKHILSGYGNIHIAKL